MISKSVFTAFANIAGGNAVAVIDGTITVANITADGTSIVATAATDDGDITITADIIITAATDADDADDDDAELLGSRALAAGGRALARKADNTIALVKGASGWVGVRA